MDFSTRLQNLVGKPATAMVVGGTITAVEATATPCDDIEMAVNRSDFRLRLDSGREITLSGLMLRSLDKGRYLIPEDCPWMFDETTPASEATPQVTPA